MSFIDKNELRERLLNKFGYYPNNVDIVINKIEAIDPQLQPAFLKWWQSGEIPAIEIEGYTVGKFMQYYRCNPIASFLNLDWLIREPGKAKKSIEEGIE